MNDAPPQSATGFWSIERFVAFVLGPAATAGSGWLSLFLAKKFGLHLAAGELLGIFSTGGLAAAGLAYKWLHGKQVEMKVMPFVDTLEANPVAGGFIHTTLEDLEKVAQSAAAKAVDALTGGSGPPATSIPSAANDPAPSTPADGQTTADAGAASAE